LKPATVASKRLGDAPQTHYLLGPQRATRAEAEADLALWEKALLSLEVDQHLAEVQKIRDEVEE
jgi:hypothetical protein